MAQYRVDLPRAAVTGVPRPDPAEGVFETMLVLAGRPVELDAHLARMAASVAGLFGAALPRAARALVCARAAGVERGRLRLTVAPAGDGATALDVRVAPVAFGVVLPSWARAVTLAAVVVDGGLGAHKWADRRLLEAAETRSSPSVPLLVDADGTALEASRASLFLVEDGSLVTPPLDGRILPGVTRRRILGIAEALGVPRREEAVPLARVLAADEVFLSGSVRGLEPVRGCDGERTWSRGRTAPLIAAELERGWQR
jgi:para-aminobenzoate synthetase/4-amino-4-deoxychorismate lyase